MQINFNSDIAEAIRNVKKPIFKMPERPEKKVTVGDRGNNIISGPD